MALATTVGLNRCYDEVIELCLNFALPGECADANGTAGKWLGAVSCFRHNLIVEPKDQVYRTLPGPLHLGAICLYIVNVGGIKERYRFNCQALGTAT